MNFKNTHAYIKKNYLADYEYGKIFDFNYDCQPTKFIVVFRLVSERLNEAGMKIKPDDVKQNSMTYSSESEDSEHSLVGGVIQYIYYFFSILVFSLHAVEAYIRHIRAELYSFLFYYFIFFIVICDCYLELCIHL